MKILPCPPFPSPIPSMVSPSPTKYQKQKFHSHADIPTDEKRKKRRTKRKWKSSGENLSRNSSNSSPDQSIDSKIDRDQEMRRNTKFVLQKNCTYNSVSDISKNVKSTKGQRCLSEKFTTSRKRTFHFKKQNIIHKSTSQITTCSPLSTKHSQKASSAMELDLLSRKQFRSTPNSYTKTLQTIKASSRLTEECVERENICRTIKNAVEDNIFLEGDLIDEDEKQTSGRESSLSYYTGMNEEPMKNTIFHPLLPSLSSSLKKINISDKYRSDENSDVERPTNGDIFASPLKSNDGGIQHSRIRITVEISPEPTA